MPANLTPQYLDAEARCKKATSPEERLDALEEMYATLPKHKGTEKLQAEIKKKISVARKENETRSKTTSHHDLTAIPREGAGRVVLAGPCNAGKSAILRAISKAEPEVAEYAFTTRAPEPGMAPWQDIQFQVIDLPAVSREYMETWVPAIIRSADVVLLVADQSSPGVLEEIEDTQAILHEHKIFLSQPPPDLPRGGATPPTLLVVNKIDLPGGGDSAAIVAEFFGDRYPVLAMSAETGEGVGPLLEAIFHKMDIVRVYSKVPGKPTDKSAPYVLRRGSNLMDFCTQVHKDFAESLKFARIWGHGKFDGQRVNRDYLLCDGDIIELHA